MPVFSVNHMTLATAPYSTLLECASNLGCAGVEVRCDLAQALFDGSLPARAAEAAKAHDLRILSLAEVHAFDDYSSEKHQEAIRLMQLAVACGAEAISLIPRNDGFRSDDQQRHENLVVVLAAYKPLLESYGLVGLIEPLGFTTSSLRSKREAVAAIRELKAEHCFKLVHDTFHHYLSGEKVMFAEHTGLVHVSGVTDSSLGVDQMQDHHRVLVNELDCLDNVGQLSQLQASGYNGPISMEAFSPEVHSLANPETALGKSFHYLASSLAAHAA